MKKIVYVIKFSNKAKEKMIDNAATLIEAQEKLQELDFKSFKKHSRSGEVSIWKYRDGWPITSVPEYRKRF